MEFEKMVPPEAVQTGGLPVIEYAEASDIPGVIVEGERAFYDVGGRLFPVSGAVRRHGRLVPIVELPIVEGCPRKETEG